MKKKVAALCLLIMLSVAAVSVAWRRWGYRGYGPRGRVGFSVGFGRPYWGGYWRRPYYYGPYRYYRPYVPRRRVVRRVYVNTPQRTYSTRTVATTRPQRPQRSTQQVRQGGARKGLPVIAAPGSSKE